MIRTPSTTQDLNRKTMDTQATEPDQQRAGPSNINRPANVRRSIDKIEQASTKIRPGSPIKAPQKHTRTSPVRETKTMKPALQTETSSGTSDPSNKTPTGDSQPIKTTTVTKGKHYNPTPSPMKVATYKNRAAEAAEVHKKGLENLKKFLNLRKDIKLEVKKALDRLYELTKLTPVARSLEEELRDEAVNKMTTDTLAHTEPIAYRDEEKLLLKIEENGRMLFDIQTMMREQKENLERMTYASATAARQNTKPTPELKALHSVIVTSENDQDTGEEVLEKVRKAIDAKQGWVTVDKIRKGRDRKIIMGCGTKEERQKIKDKLPHIFANK